MWQLKNIYKSDRRLVETGQKILGSMCQKFHDKTTDMDAKKLSVVFLKQIIIFYIKGKKKS